MRLAISGASGKTGYRIAEEALAKNYKLNLLVRRNSVIPNSLKACKRLEVNLSSKKELDKSLEGCDALIIATGARPSIDLLGPAKIDALGVKQQVESCKRVGVNRVILISSLCSGKFFHPLNLFGLILIWKRIGERSLQESGLNWTIIRPGGLNEQEKELNSQGIIYSGENTQEEGSIPRRLVAKCSIDAINTTKSIDRIIEITSSTNQKKLSLKNAL